MATVLIADDNHENIALIEDILTMSGYSVVGVHDGPTAIDHVRQEPPDIILLDINMPGMNGFDVCATLKADETTNHIPIIMVTAMGDVDYRVRGLAIGADDYLTKPFSPRELVARVERSLRAKVAADDLRIKQNLIRKTFERFVAASIVDQLLKNPDHVTLGGKLQPVTVLFADLEGFTTLSERMAPELLLQVLNAYHALLVKIILQYGGTVDKFLGDGLMALYNTPIEQEDHIDRAVKSALHIQDELHWFHAKLPPEHRLKVNFGIHTGMAVVGNVGAEDIMDFTAVGDTVNVAARLQGIADQGRILVSEVVFQAAGDYIFGRLQETVRVKGREELVVVYEISNTFLE